MIKKTIARIIKMCLPKIAYPVVKGPLKGFRCYLGSFAGDGGGIRVFFNASEPQQTTLFTKTIRENDIVFDIGANVGYYVMLASKLTRPKGGVYAVEPMISNLSWIEKHVRINQLENVSIIPMACSNKDHFASFTKGENNAVGFIESVEYAQQKNNLFIKNNIVATLKIDTLVEWLGVIPSVIKIDVEGAEEDVLLGAQNTLSEFHPKIFLSTHSDDLRNRCIAYLHKLNYKVIPINEEEMETATEFFAEAK